jgi:hypothetical protein
MPANRIVVDVVGEREGGSIMLFGAFEVTGTQCDAAHRRLAEREAQFVSKRLIAADGLVHGWHREARADDSRTIREQVDRGACAETGHLVLPLTPNPKNMATRHERTRRRAVVEQRQQAGSRRGNLFEIVRHDQCSLVAHSFGRCVQQVVATFTPSAEATRKRWQHQRRIRSLRRAARRPLLRGSRR